MNSIDDPQEICSYHRYSKEMPEPVPFSSWHGAQIGGIRVFSCDQNNRDSLDAYVLQSERGNKHA